MPVFVKRSQLARRVARNKLARRKRRLRMNRSGMIRITRKCPEQNVYNTAVAGGAAASGGVVLIGTPYQTPAFAGSSFYNIPFSIDTNLNDLIGAAELTAIADKYKINWVKVRVFSTSNTASAGSVAQLPSLLWSQDEDDAALPASSTAGLESIREKMSSKFRQFKQNGGAISMFYKPKIVNTVAGAAGAATAAGVISAPYLDTSAATIPHYGVKGYIQDVNLTATPAVYTQFKFDVTMSVSLKDIQ